MAAFWFGFLFRSDIHMAIDWSTPFALEAIFTLMMLVLLQAVLGFDNLLYISLESKKVEESSQSYVRRLGISLAIVLRIVLLFVVLMAIGYLQDPFFEYGLEPVADSAITEVAAGDQAGHAAEHHDGGAHHVLRSTNERGKYFAGSFNVHSIIVLLGGIFIIYTAFKEIMHMLAVHDIDGHETDQKDQSTVGKAVFWIVLMNLVFSFDSILSAIALTHNIWVMGLAIIVSGVLMIVMADTVSAFLKKNRMYEVLGLFILFIVGVMLVSEGGHLAHLHLFGYPIEPMAKSTFYFVIGILVFVDIIQTRYQKKLLAEQAHEAGVHETA